MRQLLISIACLVGTVAVWSGCSDEETPTPCVPNSTFCDGNTLRRCNADGTDSIVLRVCEETCSGGQCVSFSNADIGEDGVGPDDQVGGDGFPDSLTLCVPHKLFCQGNDLYICGADGASFELVAHCPGGCENGKCLDIPDVTQQDAKGEVDGVIQEDGKQDIAACVDECKEGEFVCSGIKIIHQCVQDESGCWKFDEGTPCEDGNPCTDDACAFGKGCVTAYNNAPCDDLNACTVGDVCANGQCIPGQALSCVDGNECTADSCDPATGCVFLPLDGVECTSDGNPCTVDVCQQDTCTHQPLPDGSPCGAGMVCKGGVCVQQSCDPPCGECQTCQFGQCVPLSDGTPCLDDGNPCTDDQCVGGSCNHPAKPDGLSCGVGMVCKGGICVQQSCEPPCGECQTCQFGQCVPLSDGTPCLDDGNPCTYDQCVGGSCNHPAKPDGLSCGVGMVCKGGVCVQQSCVPPCGECQTCQFGQCIPLSDGTPCLDDGNPCTYDQCLGGWCNHPAKPDGSPCGSNMECHNGECKPSSAAVQLAGNLNKPWDLAIDSNAVYFVEYQNPGQVKKVSKWGGPVETLAKGLSEPCAITTDGSFVYWIERNGGSNGTVKRVPVNGGEVLTLATGLHNAQNYLVVYQGFLYFGDGKKGGGGVIKKVSTSGGGATVIVEGNGLLNLNTAIDVDNGSVYFHNDYDQILRVSTNGGQVTVLGSGQANSIDVWGANIFFTEYNAGAIRKMPINGGSSTWLASGKSPAGVTTDGSFVYWIEFNNPGKVCRVSVNGGPVKVYSNEANSIGLAVDDSFVYYTISLYTGKGKVMKAPK